MVLVLVVGGGGGVAVGGVVGVVAFMSSCPFVGLVTELY